MAYILHILIRKYQQSSLWGSWLIFCISQQENINNLACEARGSSKSKKENTFLEHCQNLSNIDHFSSISSFSGQGHEIRSFWWKSSFYLSKTMICTKSNEQTCKFIIFSNLFQLFPIKPSVFQFSNYLSQWGWWGGVGCGVGAPIGSNNWKIGKLKV